EEESAHERGHPDEDDEPLEGDLTDSSAGERPREMPETRPERRDARVDEELVRGEQTRRDDDVGPNDTGERARYKHEDGELHPGGCRDDPGISRLAAREVVADEDVRQ